MIAAALLCGMALEIAGWMALGRQGLGWPWWACAALTLAGMLWVRAWLIGVTWVFAWLYPSAAPRLGIWQAARMVVKEYVAFVWSFCVAEPLAWLLMPADRLRPCEQPLLLVHGYGCSRGIWAWMRHRLEAAGHTVATLSLEPPWANIDVLAEQLERRIGEVCAATGAHQVTLVAHSMGGLVSRACLARHGAARVAALVTIGTPHQGTRLARIGWGRNALEMRMGSAWLGALSAYAPGIAVVSIRTAHDNFVMPQDNQRLPGAQDECLPATGHIAALYEPRTLALVLRHCPPPRAVGAQK